MWYPLFKILIHTKLISEAPQIQIKNPDRCGAGLTMTTTTAVDLQGTTGNWTTVGWRRERQREKSKGWSVRQSENIECRVFDKEN